MKAKIKQKITRKGSKMVFRDLDKALASFVKIVDKHFLALNDLLDEKSNHRK